MSESNPNPHNPTPDIYELLTEAHKLFHTHGTVNLSLSLTPPPHNILRLTIETFSYFSEPILPFELQPLHSVRTFEPASYKSAALLKAHVLAHLKEQNHLIEEHLIQAEFNRLTALDLAAFPPGDRSFPEEGQPRNPHHHLNLIYDEVLITQAVHPQRGLITVRAFLRRHPPHVLGTTLNHYPRPQAECVKLLRECPPDSINQMWPMSEHHPTLI
jgi:hypothetical protein